ncbi:MULTISPECIES: APC family permease [unclassified Microbacterium]|uniref:APC family permease n=1 Tax=unclassified Microbacterium TaxID=2609290 RepID=UPI001CBD7AEB|nr:APC family permease [Microbacterium sp. OVT16B]
MSADQTTTEHRLRGRLGTGSIVFMVIAAAAPLTVIGGNAPIAIGLGNGIGAPVGFVIATVVLLLFSVGFVKMTPHVKEAGAFFSYVTKGIDGRTGLGTAFVSLLAYTAIQVGIYGYLGWAVDDLVQHFGGPAIPWGVYSLAAVALVAVLGYRHIDLSAKVLGIALVLEIGVVIVLDTVIFATGGAEGIVWDTFDPANAFAPGLSVAVLFALTGFIGFEATAVFRDEARDPERTIPRATYLAVIIIGVFYCLSCWAMVVGGGRQGIVDLATATLAGEANMLTDMTGRYLGWLVQDIVQVLLVTSLFACVLSFHNVIARYQFALSRKGVLPARWGTVHPRHHSPAVSSLVQTVTATVIMVAFIIGGVEPLVGVFGSMAGVATVGMVLLMLMTSIAVLVFFRRHPSLREGHVVTTVLVPAAAVIGLIAAGWVVLSNFTLVTGGSVGLSVFLACLPPAVFLLGVALGGGNRLAEARQEG